MSDKITWTNERRKLSQLIPWPRNPRQIKTDQAKRLVESFDQFGQVETIAIGPDNGVYNGHQRLNVLAQKYGQDYEVEVRVASRPLDEKEREKLTIFLHKGAAGEWDFDTLANEFEIPDLLDWGFSEKELQLGGFDLNEPEGDDPGAQMDKAEELREKWGVHAGQLWRLGEHIILCGDSTKLEEVMKVIPEHCNMVFTDPPYAIFGSSTGVKSEVSDDNLIRPFFRLLAFTLRDFLCTRGHAYICCDWRTFPTIRSEIGAILQIKNNIVWSKGSAGYAGSFYSNTYENIAFFVNEAASHSMFNSYNEKGTPEHKQIYDSNVWEISRVPINDREHFAEKPVELVERAINNSTEIDMIVFDPFLGSGTTLIACERLHRKCRAVEISPAYCAVAIERWQQMTGGTPELLG